MVGPIPVVAGLWTFGKYCLTARLLPLGLFTVRLRNGKPWTHSADAGLWKYWPAPVPAQPCLPGLVPFGLRSHQTRKHLAGTGP